MAKRKGGWGGYWGGGGYSPYSPTYDSQWWLKSKEQRQKELEALKSEYANRKGEVALIRPGIGGEVRHFRGISKLIEDNESLSDSEIDAAYKRAEGISPSYSNLMTLLPSVINFHKDQYNTTRTYPQAVKVYREGWKAGVAAVNKWQSEIEAQFVREIDASDFALDFHGADVDMGLYMTGQPEHMIEREVLDTRKASPHIIVDVGVRCEACGRVAHNVEPTNPEFVAIRGAAVAILVRLLIRAGLYPKVSVSENSIVLLDDSYEWERTTVKNRRTGKRESTSTPKGRFKKITYLIDLHRESDVLDVASLAFGLAHDGLVRKLIFRNRELRFFKQYGKNKIKDDSFLGKLSFDASSGGAVGRRDDCVGVWDIFQPTVGQIEESLDLPKEKVEADDFKLPPHVIWIPSEAFVRSAHWEYSAGDFTNSEKAAKWIIDTLARFGIEMRRL